MSLAASDSNLFARHLKNGNAGDYSEITAIGTSFKFEDVNVSDLKLTGSEIPENIGMGQNLHITAVVEEYNETSGLFILNPISIEIR